VFAVVQVEQQAPVADVVDHHVQNVAAGLVHQTQGGGHTLDQEPGITQAGQLRHEDTVGKRLVDRTGDAHRQPGLAHTPDTGKRDQPGYRDQPSDARDLGATADQVGEVGGDAFTRPSRGSHGLNIVAGI
jgi:hypothetical protein